MLVSFASRIVTRVFTLRIVTASLATNVPVSAMRLLDTDLWYKTFSASEGRALHLSICDEPSDPTEWRGITRFAGALRNDPLNPFQLVERANELNPYEATFISAVGLPSATPQFGT